MPQANPLSTGPQLGPCDLRQTSQEQQDSFYRKGWRHADERHEKVEGCWQEVAAAPQVGKERGAKERKARQAKRTAAKKKKDVEQIPNHISEEALGHPEAEVWSGPIGVTNASSPSTHQADAKEDRKPTIRMEPGLLPNIVTAAEKALLRAGVKIYQRGESLVRPARLDDDEDGPVRRKEGSLVLLTVQAAHLLERLAGVATWAKPVKRRNKESSWDIADPKPVYAYTLLARAGEWKFPVLRGLLTAPTLDRDGRIIETAGYDRKSQLLLDLDIEFPPVPQNPTKADAVAALKKVEHLLRGFPFPSYNAKREADGSQLTLLDVAPSKEVDSSKDLPLSVALSAFLTVAIRGVLRATPLLTFDAPAARTGKSLLVELIGIVLTGTSPPAMSQGKSPEEDEKRLATVLSCGDPIVFLDNCEHPIQGDFLCSMLTQEVVQARILGLSERRILPANVTVFATGNNLSYAGDVCSRTVPCRLDAQMERPETREFDFDVKEEARANRADLLVALLTALRAYSVAGRPEKLTPMGGFEDWAWVRGTLMWCGYADPADARESVVAEDPEREGLVAVMDLWESVFGGSFVTVADVARSDNAGANTLRSKLKEVACRGDEFSTRSVGWWLRDKRDRMIGTRCFKQTKQKKDTQWMLHGTEKRGGQ